MSSKATQTQTQPPSAATAPSAPRSHSPHPAPAPAGTLRVRDATRAVLSGDVHKLRAAQIPAPAPAYGPPPDERGYDGRYAQGFPLPPMGHAYTGHPALGAPPHAHDTHVHGGGGVGGGAGMGSGAGGWD
ncbi:hypothetical protein FB451DRAFT_1415961 [Mycena latifolia]|nr:hypothetical protein FB451DRAFT_1415961 [Mycena latifolia]